MIKLGDQDVRIRERVLKLLNTICPEAGLLVEPDGEVKIGNVAVCQEESPVQLQSCHYLCQLITSARTVRILVNAARAAAGGGGITIDANEEDTVNGRGSDETVYIDDQNRYLPHPDWIILAHELCGHALPGMRGDHPEWRRGRLGYAPDWHQLAVDAENQIRQERGLPLR